MHRCCPRRAQGTVTHRAPNLYKTLSICAGAVQGGHGARWHTEHLTFIRHCAYAQVLYKEGTGHGETRCWSTYPYNTLLICTGAVQGGHGARWHKEHLTFIRQCPYAQVLYKEGTGHGETGVGGNWTPVMGKMRQISVGDKVSLLKGLCYEIYQTAFFIHTK